MISLTWLIYLSSLSAGKLDAQKVCSVFEIKSAICWALCRRDAYDSGAYEPKSGKCSCIALKDFSEYTKPNLEIYHDHGSGY